MRHDETRDNTTAIEANLSEADAREETRELVNDADGHELGIYRPGTWRGRMLRQAKAMFGPIRSSEPDPAGVQLANKIVPIIVTVDELPPATYPKPYNPPVQIVEQRHPEHNDGANGYDEDEPEDDGQPSEYEEWQDYMGGDEYYDHSENEMW